MAEHLFCKQVVRGSSPLASSLAGRCFRKAPSRAVTKKRRVFAKCFGGLPEWPKGADCKSAGYAFDGSNPSPSTKHTHRNETDAGVAQLVERQPSKLNVAGSNPVSRSKDDHPKTKAFFNTRADCNRPPSSVVEHFLGKEEVTGSSPVVGSIHQHYPALSRS